jgi:predicted ATPase/DNA-binding SARP family transcriptional activator
MLKLFLLGAFKVELDGNTLPDSIWPRRKAKNLLKLLALQPQHQLHLEQAIELLCPELDLEAAQRDLYRNLHTLRHVLEPELVKPSSSRLVTISQKILRLQIEQEVWIDLDQFDLLVKRGLAGSNSIPLLEEAISLYKGDLLEEDLYEDWITPRREEARNNFKAVLYRLAQLYATSPRQAYPKAITTLQQLLKLEPAHELAHRELMKVYTLAGLRQQAIQQFQLCTKILDEELGLEPEPATLELYRQIITGELASDLAEPVWKIEPTTSPTILPLPATALVGREQEVTNLKHLILQPQTRLVTITGSGGVGKTHLALEVANHLREEFNGNVVLVELATIREPEMVAVAISQTLGLRSVSEPKALQILKEYLHERHFLLVLDNFEQVLSAAGLVTQLLTATPGLKILVTSRAALRLSAEHEVALAPLELPDPRHLPSLPELAANPAMALFLRCSRAVNPAFALNNQNAATLAEICVRLNGLPLAIELAAARTKIFDPPVLLQKLAKPLKVLTYGPRDWPERQRTLRDTLEWSYQLLSPPEQQLFCRLGVFIGGCTLEAAQTICIKQQSELVELSDPESFLNVLTVLIDYNLVRRAESLNNEPRFVMLDTIREYALEKLNLSGEEFYWWRNYVLYFLNLAEKAEKEVWGAYKDYWINRMLEQEQSNVLAALDWLLQHRSSETILLAGRLGAIVWRCWWQTHLWSEGRRRLEQLVTHMEEELNCITSNSTMPGDGSDAKTEIEVTIAKLQHGIGQLAWSEGYFEEAIQAYEKSLELWHKAGQGQDGGIAETISSLAYATGLQGDFARFQSLTEQAMQLWQQLGNHWGTTLLQYNRGIILLRHNNSSAAYLQFIESLKMSLERGDHWTMDLSLSRCLQLNQAKPDELAKLIALHQKSLEHHQYRHSNLRIIGPIIVNLAILFEAAQTYEAALDYYAKALNLLQTSSDQPNLNLIRHRQGWVYLKRRQLEEAEKIFGENLKLGQVLAIKAETCNGLAWVYLLQGQTGKAYQLWQQSLDWCQATSEPDAMAVCLEGIAGLAAHLGDHKAVSYWCGAASAIRQANLLFQLHPAVRFLYRPYLPFVSASLENLGPDEFEKQWQAGKQLIPGQQENETRLLLPQVVRQSAHSYLLQLSPLL